MTREADGEERQELEFIKGRLLEVGGAGESSREGAGWRLLSLVVTTRSEWRSGSSEKVEKKK